MATSDSIDIPVRWIDGTLPRVLPTGATFGVPLPRGAVTVASSLRVVDAAGDAVPAQMWPLATWPDGTVKWSGVSIGATDEPPSGLRVRNDEGDCPPVRDAVTVHRADDEIVVDNGRLRIVVPTRGDVLIRSVAVEGREVGVDGRLVSSRQRHPEPDHAGRLHAAGVVTSVTVEQDGPIRAVVTLRGSHVDADGRNWLPFTVRLVVAAGATTFRLIHTFIWDGDPGEDFLSSLGLRFSVPLRAPLHDRHVRFAGAEGGVLREAVQGVTGLRRNPGAAVRHAQVDGRRTPPPTEWENGTYDLMRWVPAWPDYTLRQLSANAFSIAKRTAPDRPWIDVAQGTRSEGFALVGDPEGALGIGLAGFWQSHPTGLDIREATSERAELTVWMWSPDAAPMDVRFYHDGLGQVDYRAQMEALEITYEDYEADLGSAHGVSRTHEIDIVAFTATPGVGDIAAAAQHTAAAPRLCATPEALHAAHVFGDWALVSRRSPAHAAIEDRLTTLIDFYLAQVDQRSWYGFWNFGDVMHSYDFDRHTWKYDIGGYAWDNSELSTDLWLWTTFLRTGRADVFRMAEAMARHTGDVDRYHSGPLAGFGTRHNVQHWGCGCKQVRIGSAMFRRHHYYLTADEHSRDLMLSLAGSDEAFLSLDPSRKARPDEFPPRPTDPTRVPMALGFDWGSLAAAWLANWEMTGDTRSRDRLLGTMSDIAGFPFGFLHGHAEYDLERGRFARPDEGIHVSHLTAIFGLVELCSELLDLVDVPGFADAWLQYCRLYLATPEQQVAELGTVLSGNLFPQWHSRLLAYAANRADDTDAAQRAWAAYQRGGEVTPTDVGTPRRITPPEVLAAVDELQVSTNDAAQSSLAAIQNLALIGDAL